MEASSEQTGYQWKIVLDLGSDKAAVVCFNNGTGVWDSNGGKNYTIPMGTYGVMNTNISELKPVSTPKVTPTVSPKVTPTVSPKITPEVTPEVTPKVTVTPVPVENTVTLYYKKTSWSDVYCHYKPENGTWSTVPGTKMVATNEQSGYQWKIVLDLGSSNSATVCFNNGSGSWDSNNGSNYIVYKGTYGVSNQVVSQLQSVAPTTTPKVTPEVTVSPTKHQVTLYYKKTSWSNVYCHYKKADGTWTSVPGTKMQATTEKSGYQWKIVIDLGDATSTTVCFNNGGGSWDNNNRQNYTISEGTQGVSDGTVKKLS